MALLLPSLAQDRQLAAAAASDPQAAFSGLVFSVDSLQPFRAWVRSGQQFRHASVQQQQQQLHSCLQQPPARLWLALTMAGYLDLSRLDLSILLDIFLSRWQQQHLHALGPSSPLISTGAAVDGIHNLLQSP